LYLIDWSIYYCGCSGIGLIGAKAVWIRGGRWYGTTADPGAGIVLDPENNVLGKPWIEDSGMIPKAVIDIFKAEGWSWGGDLKRPHCAYFEAVNRL